MHYNHLLFVLISYSVLPGAVIGWIRYSKIPAGDHPFIWLLWVALITEVVNEITTYYYSSTAIECNIYVLVESLLYCLLFFNWGSFRRDSRLLYLVTMFLMGVWVSDNLVTHSLWHINSFFRIASSFVLVFTAIDQVNKLIVSERSKLLKNYRFLICIGVILFFTYRAYVEVFYWKDLQVSQLFYRRIYNIMIFVNLFVNLLFSLAVLWIPTRQRFTLPS
jgi:hypothetical protein